MRNKHRNRMRITSAGRSFPADGAFPEQRTAGRPCGRAPVYRRLTATVLAVSMLLSIAMLSGCGLEQAETAESTAAAAAEVTEAAEPEAAEPETAEAAEGPKAAVESVPSEEATQEEETDEEQASVALTPEEELDLLRNAAVGDVVTFGTWNQDNNPSDGQEALEWLVLEKVEDQALVVSKNLLDCRSYDDGMKISARWQNAGIRTWLNFTVYNNAFTGEERARIMLRTVSADENPDEVTSPGEETEDKLFLLSILEAEQYFDSDAARSCEPIAFAGLQGINVGKWWLRTPGNADNVAAFVDEDGTVSTSGDFVDQSNYGIRPAMWISLADAVPEAENSSESTEEAELPDTSAIQPEVCEEMMVTELTVSYLGLRSAPEDGDNETGALYNYSGVYLIEETNDDYWFVYSINDRQYGYVNAKYLTSSLLIQRTRRTITIDTNTFNVDTPWINLYSDEISALNLKIRDEDCAIGTQEMMECQGISYVWNVNGDTLSLVVGEELMNNWWNYHVYNVSISQETVLSDEELLVACGYTESQMLARCKELVTDRITEIFEASISDLSGYIEESVTDENLKASSFFANEKGQLCAVITYQMPAGPGSAREVFNLDTGEVSEGLMFP